MKAILPILLILTACGCASHNHTPRPARAPRPPAPTKGISEYGPDKFRIIYDGTRWTKQEKATDFAMLRAADTTLQHGYSYFIVLNESDARQGRTFSSPGFAQSTMFQNGSVVTSFSGGGTDSISWPYITLSIQTFTNNVEGSMDAAFLKQSLFKQYHLKSTP